MKSFFIIVFFLLAVTSFSQAVIIDSIPANGILLDKGWKFTTGDNPDYAKVDYNDNAWQSINPALDVHDSLPQLRNGVCWLRLHLFLNSHLTKSSLSFVIQQSGASEIYLNGTKIQSYGTVSADAPEVKAYDPLWKPLSLRFDTGGEQVLAVRYTLQPNLFYTKIFETENPALLIRMMHNLYAVDYYHKNASRLLGFMSLLIGIGIMIMVLHFSFYFLYPSQRANLYFALFAFTWVLANLLQLNFWLYPDSVASKFYLGNSAFALYIAGHIFLLIAAYNFLEREKDFFYYSLLIISGVAVILDAWPYGLGWKIGGSIQQMLVSINVARIALIAVSKKQRGAWIMAAGAICSFIFFVAFILQGAFTNKSLFLSVSVLKIFTNVMFNLSLPAATSIFLAFEFAFANRTLQQKLIEVNELSKKSLEQEKEKQQILQSHNETLEQQVMQRTSQLNQSLQELKSTQAQLIQSEKMASLGELTAGIAHEIQNPLNFVNNFSELNKELLEELKEEVDKGNIDEVKMIADDVIENEAKINHHGKRADAIVKGMLQHSRQTKGAKELVDINALCDEYLKLSYHGLRAKDKNFNADFKTDFDETIGKINMVPQDIGRVLLNLFNNAFYATNAKQKTADDNYKPLVSLQTKKINDKVEITVKDNGNGIPSNIISKIFQPFFTTKPTGQGTGLGLSLSYDIITKEQNGTIKVESNEGEGTTFIIALPVQ